MPGDYSDDEIRNLTTVEFQSAKQRNWKKPAEQTVQAEAPAAPSSGEYGSSWGSGGSVGEYDFKTPSGERCRMHNVPIETLLEEGILDEVSRLEGLADELIQQSEGAPPQAKRPPSAEEFKELLRVINAVARLAVVKPTVVPDDLPQDKFQEGMVRVSWISLEDRSAIMERALQDLRKLDRFRNAG